MNNCVIELRDVSKHYLSGNVIALDKISLSISRGSLTAICGKSGCGKTTLLNVMGGLDLPTSGKVVVLGKDITNMPESSLSDYRATHIGFVFQFFNLIPELTAKENILFPLAIRKKQIDIHSINKIIDLLQISDTLDRLPAQLSGGQQQRIAIARSIVGSPDILLMDEPTGNLDEENANIIKQLIRKLCTELGITIFFVTHDQDMAHIADQIVTLKDGHIESIKGVSS